MQSNDSSGVNESDFLAMMGGVLPLAWTYQCPLASKGKYFLESVIRYYHNKYNREGTVESCSGSFTQDHEKEALQTLSTLLSSKKEATIYGLMTQEDWERVVLPEHRNLLDTRVHFNGEVYFPVKVIISKGGGNVLAQVGDKEKCMLWRGDWNDEDPPFSLEETIIDILLVSEGVIPVYCE